MRLPLAILFLTIALSNADAAKQHPQQILSFGIFPYVSPVQLVKFHIALKNALAQTLGKEIFLITAPDFKQFVQRSQKSTYDFMMTAPHLGRLAEVRDGYQPIAHTMHSVQGIYLVAKNSKIRKLKDLKGKVLTLVGRTAIITQMVEQQLNKLGLYNGKNITFQFTKTHNNAMFSPLRGESDASVTGILLWNKIGLKNSNNKMRIIGKSPTSIGFQVMASKNISSIDFLNIQKLLLNFHKTKLGQTYMKKTGFKYFKKITPEAKKNLDPFIKIFLNHEK